MKIRHPEAPSVAMFHAVYLQLCEEGRMSPALLQRSRIDTCETSIVAHADVHKDITLWSLVHISASPSHSSARTAKWTGESDDRGY